MFVRGATVVASISGMFYSHVNQALDLTIELKHLLLPTPAAPRVTAVAHAATVLVVTVAATKAIQAVPVQTKSSIGSHTAQMIKVLRHLSLMLCVTLTLCISTLSEMSHIETGFSAELNSLCDLQAFYHNISNSSSTWIDSRTRFVSVQYSAYSIHSQTFAANSLQFSVSPDGHVEVVE